MIGQIYLYKYHGVAGAFKNAVMTWNYIKDNIVDNDGGEWFWSRRPDGTVNRDEDKAGFWKCPYHNSRMCTEIIRALSE